MNVRIRQPLMDAGGMGGRSELPFPNEPSAIDVAGLLRILQARKAIVMGTAAAVLAAALISFMFITQTYSATAVMMLDQRKNAVADVNAVLSGLPADTASVQNQIQVVTSRELAAKVVDKLGLDRDPEFNAAMAPGLFGSPAAAGTASLRIGDRANDQGREVAINRLLKNMRVDQVGLSTSMTISVASVDARKSARLTNAVADAYVEDQLNIKFEATQKASAWLSSRVRQVAEQLQTDEAAVQAYKAASGIVDMAAGGSIVDQQTVSVNGQLINAKADLAQKEALFERVSELQRAGRAVEATQVVASPLIAQLRAQEADLQRQEAQLSSRYLPQHPKMVDVQSQKKDTRRKIATEVTRVIDGLASDVAVGGANVKSLQESLEQLQSKFQNQGGASVKLKALESIASSSRSIYEGLLSRLKEVQGQEDIAAADVRVISRAMVPLVASPRFTMVLGIAVAAALILGLLFAFVAEAVDPSLRTSEHVDKYVGLPVLATVPEIDNQAAAHGAADMVVYETSSSYAESIRGLYLGLSLSNADRSPKVLLVTSAVPGEGKTVTAVSLARLAARHGRRVIVVDADFRRPSVANTMSLASPVGGIADVLDGRLSLEQCIVADGRSQASVLPGAARPGDPSDLMTSDALRQLIGALRGKFDLVIVDSAPLVPVHDTLLLSQFSDAALLVTQSGKTPRDALLSAVRSLRSTNTPILGVALTRMKADPRYAYHDYLYGTRPAIRSSTDARPRALASPSGIVAKLRRLVFKDAGT